MKILAKQLGGGTAKVEHELNVLPSDNGAHVKDQVRVYSNLDQSSSLKLTLNGKAIQDDQSLETQNVKEGSKLFFIVSKTASSAAASNPAASSVSQAEKTVNHSKGRTNENGTDCDSDYTYLLSSEISNELKYFLRPHFTSHDSQKIINQYAKLVQEHMELLSLDDIERLATDRMQAAVSTA